LSQRAARDCHRLEPIVPVGALATLGLARIEPAEGATTMGLLAWIIVGAIAGFLANLVMGSREGLLLMIVLGIIGALVGGFLAEALFHRGSVNGINLESIVIATLGAIVVVFVVRALQGGRGLRVG
jgi:uncharacterized membrane protein YeaQ/YmgE (transglycosylase-associated protein family)